MKKLAVLMALAVFVFSWMGCTAASSAIKTRLDDDAPFDRVDTDNNGWITQEEWDNYYPAERTRVFYDMDANHDGRVTGDEWAVVNKTN